MKKIPVKLFVIMTSIVLNLIMGMLAAWAQCGQLLFEITIDIFLRIQKIFEFYYRISADSFVFESGKCGNFHTVSALWQFLILPSTCGRVKLLRTEFCLLILMQKRCTPHHLTTPQPVLP